MVVHELLCVKANKPLFYSYYTANKTTCRNIQALFIASATEIPEFAHTVYFHPTQTIALICGNCDPKLLYNGGR